MIPARAILVLSLLATNAAVHASDTKALMTCPASAIARTEYFAALRFRESPLEPLAGVHRMKAADAGQRNHWRFEYDDQDQLRSLRFMLGDEVRSINDQGNFFVDTPQIEICTVSGMEVRHFRDTAGRPAYSRGNVAEERYRRDALGRAIELSMHDADGKPIDNGWGIARYQWQHRHDGAVVETRANLAGDSVAMRPELPFHRLLLQFGPDGNLALMSQINDQGQRIENELGAAQDRLEYDAAGQMLAWNVYDAKEQRVAGNDPRVARGIREIGPDGLQSGERYEDPTGQPMSASWGSRKEFIERDRFGNIVVQGNRDDSGALQVNPVTGCASLRMRWSEDGLQRTQVACFDAKGEPATMASGGFHRISEPRDALGRIEEMRFENGGGDLVNRPDGIARVVYRHDAEGRLASRSFFDAAGKPVAVRGKTVLTQDYRPDGYPVL